MVTKRNFRIPYYTIPEDSIGVLTEYFHKIHTGPGLPKLIYKNILLDLQR